MAEVSLDQINHQTTPEAVAELYPQYMEMIRAFVSEGVIEIEEPSVLQKEWAHRAALGDDELGDAMALLARLTERAHKQRYLDGMPMLNDFDSPAGGAHNGFEPVNRLHFLRQFTKEHRALRDAESSGDFPGVPKVLYMQPPQPEVPPEPVEIEDDGRLAAFIAATCLGEACPNYKGTACTTTESEWMTADGPIEGRDTSKPPFRDEAVYIVYGQTCLEGAEPDLVAQRVEIYKPAEANMMKLIAVTGRYGDMPVDIVTPDLVTLLTTIAISD